MIISKTPLRISFVGGGTDLPSYYREHEGFLLAAAIDKYVYVNTRPDSKRGGGAKADPNELMTAALCTLTDF